MKAKMPQSHFVSLSLASLEFCFASFLFSFALFHIFFVSRNLETLIPTETARASSVSDPHSLYADPSLAFLVNADPDPCPALERNAGPDPDLGEMFKN
jgi:hypothetical protein